MALSLYIKAKKNEIFWMEKMTKQSHAHNPELHLKDTESAIKNKLIDLLSVLRGF